MDSSDIYLRRLANLKHTSNHCIQKCPLFVLNTCSIHIGSGLSGLIVTFCVFTSALMYCQCHPLDTSSKRGGQLSDIATSEASRRDPKLTALHSLPGVSLLNANHEFDTNSTHLTKRTMKRIPEPGSPAKKLHFIRKLRSTQRSRVVKRKHVASTNRSNKVKVRLCSTTRRTLNPMHLLREKIGNAMRQPKYEQIFTHNKQTKTSKEKKPRMIYHYPAFDKIHMENEIMEFLQEIFLKVSVDVNQAYWLIMEWENYKVRRKSKYYNKVVAKHRRRGREQKTEIVGIPSSNKNYASLSSERALQLGRAKDYAEFKQLLFHSTRTDGESRSEENNDSLARFLPMALFSVPLRYPVQNTSTVSSGRQSSSGMTGGGIIVRRQRHGRDVSWNVIQEGSARLFAEKQSLNSGSFDDGDSITMRKQHNVVRGSHGQRKEDTKRIKTSFSEDEARIAYQSHLLFNRRACTPVNDTVCTLPLLGLAGQRNYLAYPHVFFVQRCTGQQYSHKYIMPPAGSPTFEPNEIDNYAMETAGSCNCDDPYKECLPTKVSVKIQPVIVTQSTQLSGHKPYTEILAVTQHHSCECLPKCENRLCISPLQLDAPTTAACTCVCPANNLRCLKLLEGTEQFLPSEIPSPLNGSYILPPCRYGPMDTIHLYHRRCPRPVSAILSTLSHR